MKWLDRFRLAPRFKFNDIGFHGDAYLLQLVEQLVKNGGVECFVETGTNVGSTLAYFTRTYPGIPALSCEPDKKAHREAVRNVGPRATAKILNMTSIRFIDDFKANHSAWFDKKVLFWLDAHGYGFEWPLEDEIRFITENFRNAYILIDDFKVPGLDCFGYDQYEHQTCSYDFIRHSFAHRNYQLFYPTYTDRTSTTHPLRGWGLIVLGEDFLIPAPLVDKMARAEI